MEERKSMGSALVDVFDAGVVLVKSEINGVAKKVGDIAKAKGLGAVLLLAAIGPLVLGLIFLILALFYLLMVWLPAWLAALVIALLSFAVTGGLVVFGMQKLSAHVDTDMPRKPVPIGPVQTNVPASPAAPVGAAIAAGKTAAAGQGGLGASYAKAEANQANHAVYESKPSGEAQNYGSGLNKKLDDHHDDPNLQSPAVLRDAPGITVSTKPTYPEDMKREGY